MALINRAGQEVSAKVVYYGPGLSGKTTNLEVLFRQVPEDHRGKMISMKTRTDRTLFFDLLPLTGDAILDFNVRILLYTVPGQVYYNATRRLVLKGVDAVVFVADSQRGKMEENLESLENLRSNLADMNIKLEELPWVIQYNKRDLPDVLGVQELEQALNPTGVPSFNAVAPRGEGVQETLGGVTEHLRPRLRALVEKELGESLRSAPAASPSRSTPPAPLPPRELVSPRGAEVPLQRSGLNLDHLPDPRVVELTPGELRSPRLKAGTPIADLMEGVDVRRALREVETSIEASPLRSLADTLPAPSPSAAKPFAPGGSAAPDRQPTPPAAPPRPAPRIVPEIVELDEQPKPSARPAANRPLAPWASPPPPQTAYAPPSAVAPPQAMAPPPPAARTATVETAPPSRSAALWASAPPAPAAPPTSSASLAPPTRPAATPPASSQEGQAALETHVEGATLTVRIPRSALNQGELILRLVLEDAPAPPATPSGGLAASSGGSPAWMATAPPVREESSGSTVPRSMASETQAGAAPEPLPLGVGRPSSAPARPAGAGMRFALRNGELVPLD